MEVPICPRQSGGASSYNIAIRIVVAVTFACPFVKGWMRLSIIGGRIPKVVRLTRLGRSHDYELMKSGGIA